MENYLLLLLSIVLLYLLPLFGEKAVLPEDMISFFLKVFSVFLGYLSFSCVTSCQHRYGGSAGVGQAIFLVTIPVMNALNVQD
jgi:hypothetical protein